MNSPANDQNKITAFGTDDDIDVPVYRREAKTDATPPTPPAPPAAVDADSSDSASGNDVDADTNPAAKVVTAQIPALAQPGVAPAAAAPAASPSEAVDERVADGTTVDNDNAEGHDSAKSAVDSAADTAPPKRDIYAALGRARPQRIEPAKPTTVPAATSGVSAPSTQSGTATQDDSAFRDAAEDSEATSAITNTAVTDTRASATTASDTTASSTLDTTTAVFTAAGTASDSTADAAVAPHNASTSAFPVAPPVSTVDDSRLDTLDTQRSDYREHSSHSGHTSDTGHADIDDPENPYTAAGEGNNHHTEGVAEKRGTLSFGLLLLRLVLGGLLLVHGLQHLFTLGGAPDIETLGENLAIYNFSDWIAFGIPVVQVVAGGLLILGLLTPLGAALGVIVSGFLALHNLAAESTSLWPESLNPQVHVWGLYALAALTLIFTGPGGISLDRNRGFVRRPLASAWIFAILGIGGVAGLWIAAGGSNPLG